MARLRSRRRCVPTSTREFPLLDLIEARARRDAGVHTVLANQDDEWRDAYRAAAAVFLRSRGPGDTFIGEDLRIFALETGIGAPRHPNAWGAMARAVLNEWHKAERIERCGWAPARAAASHACGCPA